MSASAAAPSGRSERPRTRGRKRGVVLLLVAVLVAAGSVAAERRTASTSLDPPAPGDVALADSGAAYCPVVAGEGDTAALEVASASAEEDSEIVVSRYVDGNAVADDPQVLAAGTSTILDIPAEQQGSPVVVQWRGGPVIAQYRLSGDTGAVGEQAVAQCQTQPSDRWYLAGFDTVRGSTSTLYLFNPFDQDAVVSLQFGTTEGPVDLVIAGDIQVPAGQVVVRDLAELRPETDDLAVTVRAEVGRVVAQGQVVRGPAGEGLEGITGRALLPAVAAPSSELVVAEATVDEVTQSWVTVYNPSDRQAAVQVQVSTPLGDASTLASEVTVPAGGTARVELADLSALPRLGVRLVSVNGIGLTATRISAVQEGDRTGVALASAVPTGEVSWTVPGARGPDAELTLFNPGDTTATARVELAGGAPEEWAAVAVPPNAVTSLPLGDLDPQGPALVTADVPLVAGVVNLSPDAATAYWSATGAATAALVGGGEALAVERDPALASSPVLSATATPTPTPLALPGSGEGALDATEQPSVVPLPTATPTPSPGVTPAPQATTAAPDPAPAQSPTQAPSGDPSPGASPPPPAVTESEGSLFGKVIRRGRRPPAS